MCKIFSYCKAFLLKYKLIFTFYIIICLIISIISIITPIITGKFIDRLVSAQSSEFIIHFCLILISVSILNFSLGYINNLIYIKLQTKASFDLNRNVLKHMQKVSLSYINKQEKVYLTQRINHDSNTVISFCINVLQYVVINLCKIIVPMTMICRFDYRISIVIVVMMGIYFLSYTLLKDPLFSNALRLKENQAKLFSKLNEQMEQVKFIKTNGLVSVFIDRLNPDFASVLKSAVRYQKINSAYSGLDVLFFLIMQASTFLFAGSGVVQGKISIGEFTIINSFSSIIFSSITYFFNLGKNIQDTAVAYKRLTELGALEDETNGSIVLEKIEKIVLDEVSFSHGTKTILSQLCYSFEIGNIYSITGSNGTGKTTLVDLVIGLFIDDYAGKISYNDIPINKIDMYYARQLSIGVAEQEPVLLSDTILNYLAISNPIVDETLLHRLITNLGLSDFFATLPGGLNYRIDEKSTNLSGGEKQKLALLRTLLKKPNVLILDEPTSALDKKSATALLHYLQEIKKDSIILLITHDPTIIEGSDYELHL